MKRVIFKSAALASWFAQNVSYAVTSGYGLRYDHDSYNDVYILIGDTRLYITRTVKVTSASLFLDVIHPLDFLQSVREREAMLS